MNTKIISESVEDYQRLGNTLYEQGKLEEAVQAYLKALSLQPNPSTTAAVLNNLGNIFKEQGKLEAALESYKQAIRLDPNRASFYHNLGATLCDLGKLEEGIKAYQQVLNLQPDFAPSKLGICIAQLPIIYGSVDEILLRRNNYQQCLQNLAEHYQAATPEERVEAAEVIGFAQPFYLAYQGLNDRPLQQIYGEMIADLMSSRYPQYCQPISVPTLQAHTKVRVGFISAFFRNHSCWKLIKGWVENLDRTEFELFGYHTGAQQDQETINAANTFDKFIQGPLPLKQWCELIQRDNIHILIFPEFGMDCTIVQLGCLRLASIQMASWIHPETSGLPTIDYYLTSDLMEPENAQNHYTEQLVRLPNLSVCYTPLAIQPQAIKKQDIGIADDETMLWCCQSLFKYLPQHDDVFPQIAKELVKCKFVFIEAPQGKYITEVFRQRLDSAFNNYGLNYQDHCIILPRLDTKAFAGTAAIADVFLDSIGWSGGNTTLEAIAYNIPVMTLPGEMMRGRHTMAFLKMMGIEEMIAATKEDYVKIAVRLGQDAQYRQQISQKVSENKHKLYGDLKPIRSLEDFLLKVVNKQRRFSDEVVQTLQLAIQHHQANRLDDAQELYHQVLEKQPDHPEALHNLGMVALQSGQLQAAEQWLSAASQHQPDSIRTWFKLGNIHLVQKQYSEAVNAYRQALELRPDLLQIYNNLAFALEQLGQLEEAIECYQKALAIKPDFTEAEANLGNLLQAQGKLSPEKQLYYAQLNHKLGIAWKQAGNVNKAVAYYRQAIALKADLVEAYYNLLAVFQEQGAWKEAIACYQTLLQSNPSAGEAYLNSGLTNAKASLETGNVSAAFRSIQEILTLDRSVQVVEKVFIWLAQDEAAAVREQIVSKLLLETSK